MDTFSSTNTTNKQNNQKQKNMNFCCVAFTITAVFIGPALAARSTKTLII